MEEKRERRMAAIFWRVKAVVGSEQVNAAINRAKQQERIEAKQKWSVRRKHDGDFLLVSLNHMENQTGIW